MLTIKDLRVNYGGIEAVKGISFEVPEKSIVTLIGANGAGKSTTCVPSQGWSRPPAVPSSLTARNFWHGHTGYRGQRHYPGTGRPPGIPRHDGNREHKDRGYLRSDSLEDDINWVYDLFPRLKERSWQLAGTLSGGEQQMLAVARALMSHPKLMMMDEPPWPGRPDLYRIYSASSRKYNNKANGPSLLI